MYYGDEIGMGENVYLGDRNGVRTPMQWSPDRNAGFSSANPQKLYLPVNIDPAYHYEAINVESQQDNANSLLNWTKRLIEPGVHPSVEMGEVLTVKRTPRFANAVQFADSLEYVPNTGESTIIGVLHCFVRNEATAWQQTRKHLEKFIRRGREAKPSKSILESSASTNIYASALGWPIRHPSRRNSSVPISHSRRTWASAWPKCTLRLQR